MAEERKMYFTRSGSLETDDLKEAKAFQAAHPEEPVLKWVPPGSYQVLSETAEGGKS